MLGDCKDCGKGLSFDLILCKTTIGPKKKTRGEGLKEIGAPGKPGLLLIEQVHAPDNDLTPGIWTRGSFAAQANIYHQVRGMPEKVVHRITAVPGYRPER